VAVAARVPVGEEDDPRREGGAVAAPPPRDRRLDAARVLALQATAGNHAVGNLLARDKAADDARIADLAKAFGKRLAKDRPGVLAELGKLGDADRQALLAAAPKALPAAQAELLRRCIAFVIDPPAAEKEKHDVPKVTDAGKLEVGDDVGKDKVEVRSGVDYQYRGGSGSDGFSVSYKGEHAPETRLLQFIWREVVACHPPKGKPAKRAKGTAATPLDDCERVPLKRSTSKGYDLTTDPAKPDWHVDVGSADSPFRETNTAANRTAQELAVFDAPDPRDDLAVPLLAGDDKPEKVVSHAHFALYVVQGMDIVHASEVDLYWVFTSEKVPPVLPIVSRSTSRKLDAAQRAQLAGQFQKHPLDYLP
jgi:hypothetical protein